MTILLHINYRGGLAKNLEANTPYNRVALSLALFPPWRKVILVENGCSPVPIHGVVFRGLTPAEARSSFLTSI